MARGGKVMRAGHRLGGGVGVFVRHRLGEKDRRFGAPECKRTHSFGYPRGKPLEAKLLKEV